VLINQQRNLLVTIGEDEQLTPQKTALCLKVFDLDKMQPESSSRTSPDCVGILRIFTNQFPEAKVTNEWHACYCHFMINDSKIG